MSGFMMNVSKTMSYLLRHGATKENIAIRKDGYVLVDDLLKHKNLKNANVDMIKQIVENDKKTRYNLKTENNKLYIRANQGHSIIIDDLELEKINKNSLVTDCIHGTYYEAWKIIKNNGLSKMGRNHIHFAMGLPGSSNVISGMRSSCEVIIYMDVNKCLDDGIELFKSKNGVLLSSGNQYGFILPKYFEKVIDVKTGETLL